MINRFVTGLVVTTGGGDNFWNCLDLNKKSLRADYQSKRCTMTVLSEALAFESRKNISYQFAY